VITGGPAASANAGELSAPAASKLEKVTSLIANLLRSRNRSPSGGHANLDTAKGQPGHKTCARHVSFTRPRDNGPGDARAAKKLAAGRMTPYRRAALEAIV
jgi:hypothetical protein